MVKIYLDDKVAKEYYLTTNKNNIEEIKQNNELLYKNQIVSNYINNYINTDKVAKGDNLKERILKFKPYEYSDMHLKIVEQMKKDNYIPEDYVKHGVFAKFGNTIVQIVPGLEPRRVPAHILGPGVLGRWWVGTDYAEILETLHGEDFEAVLDHENYHALNPTAPESRVRERTKNLFPGFMTNMYYNRN
jgi:hypothetical protein